MNDLSNAVYAAALPILESAEHAGTLRGNGHHAAQHVALMALLVAASRGAVTLDRQQVQDARALADDLSAMLTRQPWHRWPSRVLPGRWRYHGVGGPPVAGRWRRDVAEGALPPVFHCENGEPVFAEDMGAGDWFEFIKEAP